MELIVLHITHNYSNYNNGTDISKKRRNVDALIQSYALEKKKNQTFLKLLFDCNTKMQIHDNHLLYTDK
jgi:hypothetical protein